MLGIEFSKNQKLALLAIIGFSAIALSFTFARNRAGGNEVVLREPGSTPGQVVAADSDAMPYSVDSSRAGKIVVHVVGCVNVPGVYTLPAGSRVYEAIRAAGGAKPNADVQAINLAAKADDGSRIDVSAKPSGVAQVPLASAATSSASTRSTAPSSNKFAAPGEGTVNINSASVDELQRLPGVGPATAEKIMAYRSQIGRFTASEQLMDVKGIGPKKLEKMRPFISL